jgi:hypothetical protein
MLFLQQGPADTLTFMIAGYAVIFGVILIYLASLAIRNRNFKQDIEILQEFVDYPIHHLVQKLPRLAVG